MIDKPHTRRLIKVARVLKGVRDAAEEETTPVKVTKTLRGILGDRDVLRIKPTDLLKAFNKDHEWMTSTRGLADLLNPLGLHSRTLRDLEGGRRGRGYEITRAHLDDLWDRYGVPNEDADEARDEVPTPLSPEE